MLRLLFIVGLFLAWASPGWAQSTSRIQALIVSVCGTAPNSGYTVGTMQFITMDPNGQLCPGTGGGVGGAATIADGADATEGAIADAAASPGGAGTVSAKLRETTSLLDSIKTGVASPWPAGEAHGGQVGGLDAQTTTTPTVTASAYSAGNCVGGFNAVTIARISGGNGLIQNVILMSKTGLTPTLTVFLFNANPSSSTCADKSTFTLNAADLPKLITAPFALSLVAPNGATPSMAEFANMARPFVAGGSSGSGVQTVYFGMTVAAAVTPASTSEFVVNIGADLN